MARHSRYDEPDGIPLSFTGVLLYRGKLCPVTSVKVGLGLRPDDCSGLKCIGNRVVGMEIRP